MLVSRRIALSAGASFLFAALCATTVAQPLLLGPAAAAQSDSSKNPVVPGVPPVTLTDVRAQNAEQLRLAQRKLEANGAADKATAREVAFLRTRDALLAQRAAVEQQIKDLNSRKTRIESQIKTPPAPDKPPTFADLDKMKDDLSTAQAKAAMLADKLDSAKSNKERAQSALDECQVKNRQAQAAFESGKDGAKAAELALAAERARREAELANETLTLRTSELEREQLGQDVQQLSVKMLQDRVARTAPLVTFTEADYQQQIEDIKKNQESTASALSDTETALRSTDVELADLKKQQETTTGADRTILTEKMAAQWRTKQRLSEEIDALSQRMQQLGQLHLAWSRRYELASAKRDPNDHDVYLQLKAQQKETKQVLEELSSGLRIQILTMKNVRNDLTSVAKKADAAAKGPAELQTYVQEQAQQLEDTLRIYDQRLVSIEATRRVHEKLLDEINENLKALTPESIALGAWYQFKTVWDYSFMHVDKEPITVGNAIQGVATLLFGWMLARFLSALVAYRVLKRFKLSKDATSAIRSLVFYCMLVGVVLESMRMVHIDLTAFTILGGALAIGVGFGSQALINNFIGGLIMLAERPVRLGERITFGGTDGVVEDVGFRCTKVRTSSDHLLTIPNSTLVNESIENIDRRRTIRRKLNIPVTYNVTREMLAAAVQAIREVLEEKAIRERIHPIIGFEEYSPKVFFSEFAAESLTIQIVYWYAPADWWGYMEHSERVNFRIMEEFERLGIDFAFPSKTSFVKKDKKIAATSRDSSSFAA
jgi:small-conductance mechanosensitive channel